MIILSKPVTKLWNLSAEREERPGSTRAECREQGLALGLEHRRKLKRCWAEAPGHSSLLARLLLSGSSLAM